MGPALAALPLAWARIVHLRRRPGTGQGLVEYGLILGLSALLTIVILAFFGGSVSDALQLIGSAIDRSTAR